MTILSTLIGFSVLPGFRDQSINSPMTTVERIPISIVGQGNISTGNSLSEFAMNANVYWSSQHYLLTISVGKPANPLTIETSRDFRIKVVTDSTVFWIPQKFYDQNLFRRRWWTSYVSIPGENNIQIDGYYARDDLQLGKMQARNEKIIIASAGAPLDSMKRDQYQGVLGSGYKTTTNLNMYDTPFYHFLKSRQYTLNYQGVLGSGYKTTTNLNMYDTPFYHFLKSRQYTLNVYSFYIYNESYGELVIGEVDPIHGALSYVAVCDTDEPWTIEFSQVKLDHEAILDNHLMIAQFNPARAGIMVPKMELNTIILALDREGFSFAFLNGRYVALCYNEKLPTLRFQFGEAIVNLTSDDYMFRSGNYCVLALSPQTDRKTWVFGQVFFRIMYTVFEWGTGKQIPKMGFAKYR
ncbi:hypothetical protein ABG067_002109 [Albugo candida]